MNLPFLPKLLKWTLPFLVLSVLRSSRAEDTVPHLTERRDWSSQGESIFENLSFLYPSLNQYRVEIQRHKDSYTILLGTCWGHQGLILTKASDLPEDEPLIGIWKGQAYPLKTRHLLLKWDLAVLEGLPPSASAVPADVQKPADELQVGSILISSVRQQENSQPAKVSIMSSSIQPLPSSGLGIGVMLEDLDHVLKVREVLESGPADIAGIQPGDIITKVNEKPVQKTQDLMRSVSDSFAGQWADVTLKRGKNTLEIPVRLANRAALIRNWEGMNGFSGVSSWRVDGFDATLTHSAPIDAQDLGGPLLDLFGNLVAINIARSSRVNVHALPIHAIEKDITELIQKGNPVD